MSEKAANAPGIVLQPEEGQSYWQPIWANGYSIVKLSPKHAGPENIAMGVQVIAPGGMCASIRTTRTRKSCSALPEREPFSSTG